MEELEVVARQLRRHAVRRNEGVPTVSLLVGEPAALAITLPSSGRPPVTLIAVSARHAVTVLCSGRYPSSTCSGGQGLSSRSVRHRV